MNEVKRKQGESFDAMFRRFKRRIQQSGIDQEVRHRKVLEPEPNKTSRRNSKVRGLAIASKMHWLVRSGRATEADLRTTNKKRR
ncbi:30S ribosomal protein S21 [Candidatus Uhrbacteria bacterium]|nr:30S ribosomal protein S21 [Candidatus Uhrbacteria bacterium]